MNQIIKKIKDEMYNQNLTAPKLAVKSGVNVRTVQRILNDGDGKTSNIYAMCKALNLDLYLYESEKMGCIKESKPLNVSYETYAELLQKYDKLKEVIINQAVEINNLRDKLKLKG